MVFTAILQIVLSIIFGLIIGITLYIKIRNEKEIHKDYIKFCKRTYNLNSKNIHEDKLIKDTTFMRLFTRLIDNANPTEKEKYEYYKEQKIINNTNFITKLIINDISTNIITEKYIEQHKTDYHIDKFFNKKVLDMIDYEECKRIHLALINRNYNNIDEHMKFNIYYKNKKDNKIRGIVDLDINLKFVLDYIMEEMYKKYPLKKFDKNFLDVKAKHKNYCDYIKDKNDRLLLSLDFKKAYDHIDLNYILTTMDKYGLSEYKYVIEYFRNCEYIYGDNCSLIRNVGIPQGISISSYLFCLVSFDILEKYKKYFDFSEIFVDDILILLEINNIEIKIEKFKKMINEFGLANLILNYSKTKYINHSDKKLNINVTNYLKQFAEIIDDDYIVWLGMYISKNDNIINHNIQQHIDDILCNKYMSVKTFIEINANKINKTKYIKRSISRTFALSYRWYKHLASNYKNSKIMMKNLNLIKKYISNDIDYPIIIDDNDLENIKLERY
jgi:hypothetical protein